MKRSDREDVAEGVNESQLWLAFKDGSEQAFAKIFHRYHKKLCHYGYRIVPDKDIVKDCVQELFISLWNNRERLDYTVAINFYLIKSLRGRILRVLNKQKKLGLDGLSIEDSSQEFLFLSTEDSMIAEQSQQEQQDQLLKAMNNLSKKHREVIYLKFFLDLSYQQIAEVMAINYQVTRNYAYQAVKILREKIDLVVCISLIYKLLG
ncbi:MAG: sigma-70 family RNA polymerase sigma factor [Bacteroidota bacterium]